MGSDLELVVERWESDAGEAEAHFFLAGTDRYVFGLNPAFVSEAEVAELLLRIGGRVLGKRER